MFCSNCGSKVPDGSRFCSTCGAKLAAPEVPADLNDAFKAFSAEKEEQPAAAKKPAVSFDWSEVKEESHKREIPQVHSPWGAIGLDENEVEADLNTAAQERSRTMSFIEILKKEREEKALAAEEEARTVTEREETPKDYSPFESAPSYYVPPMYENVSAPVETPFEEPKFEKPEFKAPEYDVPKHGEPASYEPVYEMPTFEPINMEPAEPVEEPAPAVPEYKPFEPAFVAPAFEESTPAAAPVNEVKEEPVSSLDAELAAILEASAGKPVGEDMKVDLFKETESAEDLAEEYLAMDEFAAEEPAVAEAPETVEEPVVEEAAEDPESEIEALKRRLAELMGETVEPEPEVQESEDIAEGLADVAAELEEAEEVPLVDPMPVEEPALEMSVPEIVETEESDEEEKPGTDAMSVEDLEKDLFGEPSEDDVEAEATKKIDKFYTLYKKNEEFQKLLDEEYSKLQTEGEATPAAVEEVVPTVQDVLASAKPAEDKLSFEAPKEGTVPVVAEKAEETVSAPEIIEEDEVPAKKSKAELKAEKAAEKAAARAAKLEARNKVADAVEEEFEEEGSAGGTVLTVIAVVIAVLLVVLLGIILVLNFAPDSGIALKIDSVIETITSYFSVVDVNDTFLL